VGGKSTGKANRRTGYRKTGMVSHEGPKIGKRRERIPEKVTVQKTRGGWARMGGGGCAEGGKRKQQAAGGRRRRETTRITGNLTPRKISGKAEQGGNLKFNHLELGQEEGEFALTLRTTQHLAESIRVELSGGGVPRLTRGRGTDLAIRSSKFQERKDSDGGK